MIEGHYPKMKPFPKILLCIIIITFISTDALPALKSCFVENEGSRYNEDNDNSCDFKKITCSDIGFLFLLENVTDLCDGYCSQLSVSNSSIISFDSNTIPTDRICGLLYLELTHASIETITEDAVLAFPKMLKLTLDFNKITNLEFLDSLKELKELNMRHNKLIQMNAKDFRHLLGLEVINMAYNDMTTIGNSSYALEVLQEFYLNNNQIVDVEERVFEKLHSLRILNLSRNQIKLIKQGTFENLTNLVELYLQENRITLLAPYSFNALTSLKMIDLSKNIHLNQISIFTFNGLGTNNYVTLNLSSCNISFIQSEAFDIYKVEWLDLSNNKLNSLKEGIFLDTFTIVKKIFLQNNPLNFYTNSLILNPSLIDLSGCNSNITILQGNFLRKAGNLFDLKLTGTSISSIDPLAFNDSRSLRSLDLSNNKIRNIKAYTFSALVQLSTLHLSGNPILKVFKNSFFNLDQLRTLSITGINLVVEEYIFESLKILYYLDFVDSSGLQLNSKCFSHFNNLKRLRLTNTTIKSINSRAFCGIRVFPRLNLCQNGLYDSYSLNLCNASLRSIASNAFSGTQTPLKIINLNNNNIEVIETSAFKEMANLNQIKLEGTNVTFIDSLAFSNLNFATLDRYEPSTSRGVYLSFNNIMKIAPHSFTNIVGLGSLNLSYSKVRNIESFSFSNLSFCDREDCNSAISLNHNNINNISNNTFTEISNVKIVDLSYNEINELDSNIFNSVSFRFDSKHKNSIFLNNNLLTNLKKFTFNGLKNLQELHLEHNKIHKLEENVFNGLTMMRTMSMSGKSTITLNENRLTKLSKETFNGLYNLDSLEINHNLLTTVELETFLPLPNLTSLDLSYNNFSAIAKNTFIGLHNLSWLSLANNNLIKLSSESFVGLTSLADLLMSENNIEHFPLGTFQNFPTLKNLQLGHNRLSELKSGSFSNLEKLNSLNLSHNKFVTLDETALYTLDSLIVLNLDNNMLSFINYTLLLDHLIELHYISVNDNNWTCNFWLKSMLKYFKKRNLKSTYDPTHKFADGDGFPCSELGEDVDKEIDTNGVKNTNSNATETRGNTGGVNYNVPIYVLFILIAVSLLISSFNTYKICSSRNKSSKNENASSEMVLVVSK